MRKRNTQNKTLKMASQLRDLLLYQIGGVNLAKKPEFDIPITDASFAEKKGLYAELLKHAQIELKIDEDQPEQSGLDLIRKQLNDDRTYSSRGNNGGATESDSDESRTDSEEASDNTGADGSPV